MAPSLEEEMTRNVFSPFVAGLLAVLSTCLLVLCTLCKRKDKNENSPQNGVALDEAALMRQAEFLPLRGSVPNLQKCQRANSKKKSPRPASINIPCSLNEDDGTMPSGSFIILPQRELPQIPTKDQLSLRQTFSNLNFPNQDQEVLYESVAVIREAKEESSSVGAECVPGGEEEVAVGVEYACVLKGKEKKKEKKKEEEEEEEKKKEEKKEKKEKEKNEKKKEEKKKKEKQQQMGSELGTSQTTEEPSSAESPSSPKPVQVEEMYSVVCKDRKKKAKAFDHHGEENGLQVERRQGSYPLGNAHQEPDVRTRHPSPLVHPPTVEPCYEAISYESWVSSGRNQTTEPAYEAVETFWKSSRRKAKPDRNTQGENLYESIDNLSCRLPTKNSHDSF